MSKTCIKECAAHAARLFLLIQAIKLLIFGDVLSLMSSFLKIPSNPWKLSYVVQVSANCDKPQKT